MQKIFESTENEDPIDDVKHGKSKKVVTSGKIPNFFQHLR